MLTFWYSRKWIALCAEKKVSCGITKIDAAKDLILITIRNVCVYFHSDGLPGLEHELSDVNNESTLVAIDKEMEGNGAFLEFFLKIMCTFKNDRILLDHKYFVKHSTLDFLSNWALSKV
jgi:hypothetical protein